MGHLSWRPPCIKDFLVTGTIRTSQLWFTCRGRGMPGSAPLMASDNIRAMLGSPSGRPHDAAISRAPSRGSPKPPPGSTRCAALCASAWLPSSSGAWYRSFCYET